MTDDSRPRAPVSRDPFRLDPVAYTVGLADGRTIALTPREFRLLHYLLAQAGQILSAREILRGVWGFDEPGAENLVAVYIRRLRAKIEPDAKQPRHIITRWRQGYTFHH